MKNSLDSLLEDRTTKYYKRLVKAYHKDMAGARDKEYALRYYIGLADRHERIIQNSFPKAKLVLDVMGRYYRLGKPIEGSIREVRQSLKSGEIAEIYALGGKELIDEIDYDIISRTKYAEELKQEIKNNYKPLWVDIEEAETLNLKGELETFIFENVEDMEPWAVPKSYLDREEKRNFNRQKLELFYNATSFLHFTDSDFVYFFADQKAKDDFYIYIRGCSLNELDGIEETEDNKKTEKEHSFQQVAAMYLLLEHFKVITNLKGLSLASVSRFIHFFTGKNYDNIYKYVLSINNYGFPASRDKDLKNIRPQFETLGLDEIVKKIDNLREELKVKK